jgi:hypothetical protein
LPNGLKNPLTRRPGPPRCRDGTIRDRRIVSAVAGLDLLTSDHQVALSYIERHACLVETADDGGTVLIRPVGDPHAAADDRSPIDLVAARFEVTLFRLCGGLEK